jgi:hypothetical protein
VIVNKIHIVPAKARSLSAGLRAVLTRATQTTLRGAARSTIPIAQAKGGPTTIRKKTKTFDGEREARAIGFFYRGSCVTARFDKSCH